MLIVVRRIAVLFVLLAISPLFARGADAPRPNFLFLISDDQRPDTISALGNAAIHTPHLDSLVRGGVSFTRAVCANPICTPSRAEILTGCSSMTNGVLDFGRKIDPKLKLWPQAMREAGYHTWYVGKWHNDGRPHLRGYEESQGLFAGGGGRWAKERKDFKGFKITGYRGWVFQDDEGKRFPEQGVGLSGDISRRFADAAISFLRRRAKRPFFLHVNFTAPHDPLLTPPGYEKKYGPARIPLPGNFLPKHPFDHGNLRGRDEVLMHFPRTKEAVRRELAMYYRVISHMDEQIGRVLAALEETGQAKNTIVIFSSDHGLGMGSHGLRGKQSMYEHTIGVPLIFRGPGLPKNARRAAQVYLRDLYPTCCELAGIKVPDSVEGRSLAGVIKGKQESVRPHVFGYFRNFQRMIRTDRWKLIYYPHLKRYQLFDLNNDLLEKNDLSADKRHANTLTELREKLHAWQRKMDDPAMEER